ncbi:MAG: hypothetical protein PHW18_10110 [Sulfuricurvum sp.]|nr:hypothetical protein [Sulfuricurvum sp.]MDD2829915.1 hypothetical protein [Sulfuricurvum sp.]MDD4949595.1 hypothetical protein [Sulfuricurvum sp.]
METRKKTAVDHVNDFFDGFIDIDNKKFVEIDTKNVKCELNEDSD